MANWLYIIDLKHLTDQVKIDDDVIALGKGVIKILKEFKERARKYPSIEDDDWEYLLEPLDTIIEYFELKTEDELSTLTPSEIQSCREEIEYNINELASWGNQYVYRRNPEHVPLGRMAWINYHTDVTYSEFNKLNGYIPSHLKSAPVQ